MLAPVAVTVKKAAKAAEKAAAKAAKGTSAAPRERNAPKKEKEVKPKEPEEAPYVNTTPKGEKKGEFFLLSSRPWTRGSSEC